MKVVVILEKSIEETMFGYDKTVWLFYAVRSLEKFQEEYPEIKFDPMIITLILAGSEIGVIEDYVEQNYPEASICTGRLVIEWVEPGKPFIIEEYDGHEKLTFMDHFDWQVG
jgi:hypothetical protein